MSLPTLLLAIFLFSLPAVADDGPLHLAVAANFRATAEKISALFTRATGTDVIISSAATGVLYNQIIHGAPFDLLLAADSERPELLAASGRGDAATQRCYARGRLVLLGRPAELGLLRASKISMAIANPTTAPFGAAAAQVLARQDFASGAGREVVLGANVVQAYQFYASGAADVALVSRSLVPAGTGIDIPANWHQPIEQQAIVVSGSPRADTARSYIKLLGSAEAMALIEAAGYDACP